jgi:membrane protein
MVLSDSLDGWSKHKARRLGASLACYALLSLAPLLLVFVAVVGLVFGQTAAEHGIVERLRMLVGNDGATAAEALLKGSRNKTHGVVTTAVGLTILLYGASGVMIELKDALNTIWEVPSREVDSLQNKALVFIKDRFFSFVIVLWIGFLLVVLLAVTTWIAAAGEMFAPFLPAHGAVLYILNLSVSFILITFVFAAIYKIMPDVHLQWHDVVLGSAVTSLLFTIGKLLLGIYLGKASVASSYGAFGSIVVLVVWVYYSAQIFYLGAEFTKTFANNYGSQPSRNPEGKVKAAINTSSPAAERSDVIP